MKIQLLPISNRISFSNLSRDFNPIHVNEDYLVDTQYEKNLEYGANILLSALEHLLSKKIFFIEEINCEFIKPLKGNSDLKIYTNKTTLNLLTFIAKGALLVSVRILLNYLLSKGFKGSLVDII